MYSLMAKSWCIMMICRVERGGLSRCNPLGWTEWRIPAQMFDVIHMDRRIIVQNCQRKRMKNEEGDVEHKETNGRNEGRKRWRGWMDGMDKKGQRTGMTEAERMWAWDFFRRMAGLVPVLDWAEPTFPHQWWNGMVDGRNEGMEWRNGQWWKNGWTGMKMTKRSYIRQVKLKPVRLTARSSATGQSRRIVCQIRARISSNNHQHFALFGWQELVSICRFCSKRPQLMARAKVNTWQPTVPQNDTILWWR